MSTTTTAAPAVKPTTATTKPKPDEVTLLIKGQRYGGWKDVRVSRSLEHACGDFHVQVSERYPTMSQPWRINPGDEVEVHFGDDLLITGYVDSFKPSMGPTDHAVEIAGRSKTCDFVDSSVNVDGGQFNGQTLLEIAKSLAKPFNLEVVTETAASSAAPVKSSDTAAPSSSSADDGEDDDDGDEPIDDAQCQQSETCFQMVERLARLQELLLTDNAKGQLVICVAGSKKASSSLVQGRNIKQASADLDMTQRFQKYVVKAQRPGNKTKDNAWAVRSGKRPWQGFGSDASNLPTTPNAAVPVSAARAAARRDERAAWWAARAEQELRLLSERAGDDGEDTSDDGQEDDGPGTGGGHDAVTNRGAKVITQIVATAIDDGVKRYRVHVIVAEAAADDMRAEQRADWERRRRIAKSLKASVTVVGWRQADGRLWATNETVHIKADWLGLDQDMLVGKIDFQLGSGGATTQLELTLPDAYLPNKIKKKKKARKAKGKKGKRGHAGGPAWAGFGT